MCRNTCTKWQKHRKTTKKSKFSKLDKSWTNIEHDVRGYENNILICFFEPCALEKCIETDARNEVKKKKTSKSQVVDALKQQNGSRMWKNIGARWKNEMGTIRVQKYYKSNRKKQSSCCWCKCVYALPAREEDIMLNLKESEFIC